MSLILESESEEEKVNFDYAQLGNFKDPLLREMTKFLQAVGFKQKHINLLIKEEYKSLNDLKQLEFNDLRDFGVSHKLCKKFQNDFNAIVEYQYDYRSELSRKDPNHTLSIDYDLQPELGMNDLQPGPPKDIRMCDLKMNIILLGDVNVGKTTLITRIKDFVFDSNRNPTYGISSIHMHIPKYKNKYTVHVVVHDTAGMERYHSIAAEYYRKAQGALLVYDMSNEESLHNLQEIWFKQAIEKSVRKVKKLVVCNKIDLKDYDKKKEQEQYNMLIEKGNNFAEYYHLNFKCTSAKTGKFVRETFQGLCRDILNDKKLVKKLKKEYQLTRNNNIDIRSKSSKKSKSCCG